jgi:hypothetical protein
MFDAWKYTSTLNHEQILINLLQKLNTSILVKLKNQNGTNIFGVMSLENVKIIKSGTLHSSTDSIQINTDSFYINISTDFKLIHIQSLFQQYFKQLEN